MAERNQRSRSERSYRDNDYNGSRQAEQFDDTSYDQNGQLDEYERDQIGEGGTRNGGNYYYEEVVIIPRRSRNRDNDFQQRTDYRGTRSFDNRDRGSGGARYDNSYDRGFGSFTSEDQGGADFVRGGRRPHGGYGAGYGGGYSDYDRSTREFRGTREPGYGYRGDYGRDHRGFFDKAGDEIASWFGDEDAARRREMDHRGRGPGNYTRSDERILEDACDHLTDDWAVDARNVQVTVKDAEVTLDGTVDNRRAKRRAEDCVHDISGVKHVQNNLRIRDRAGDYSPNETTTSET